MSYNRKLFSVKINEHKQEKYFMLYDNKKKMYNA